MRYLLSLLLSLVTLLATCQDRFVSQTGITFDNQYQNSLRQHFGYERNIEIKRKDTTLTPRLLSITPLIGWRCYFYDGLVTDYIDPRMSLSYKHSRTLFGNLNVSYLQSKNWSPVFFDGFVRYQRGRLNIEAFVERESVGTPVTNLLRYVSTTSGLSADYRITRNISVVNSLAHNQISDGNNRWYIVHRTIYALNRSTYVDLKIRRMFGSDWSTYYFSPNYINQANVGYGLFMPVRKDRMYLKFYVGAGMQEIDNEYMSMFNVEMKTSTNRKKWNVELILGSRNFNEYVYNTISLRVFYTFEKRKGKE